MAAARPTDMKDGSPPSNRSPPPPSRLVAAPAPAPSSAMAAVPPRSGGAEHGDDRTNIVAGNRVQVEEHLVDDGDSEMSKNLRRRTQKEIAGCGNEQDKAPALSADGDEDDTLAFIIQVKEEVERCVEAGMSKEQMFRELREKGLPPAATFAVYKELHHQNKDFFKEYYLKVDLRKQAGRLKLLLHQYQTVRAGGADTRPQGTSTQQTTTAAPDDVELPKNGPVLVGLHGNRQPLP